jgi:hypothetical protein
VAVLFGAGSGSRVPLRALTETLAGLATVAFFPAATSQPAAAAPSPQTFVAVADAYVQSYKATTHYGTTSRLTIDASPTARGYVRFNVSGLAGTVTRATLRLTGGSGSTVGFGVRDLADDAWVETTITYANAPTFSPAVIGSSGSYAAGRSISIDVTPLVGGNGPVSIVLTTTSTSSMSVKTRESSGPPQLVVETTSGPPAPCIPARPRA